MDNASGVHLTNPAIAAIAAVCIAGYGPLWARARYVITVIHEGGHGLAALLTGRRLNGIRLHRDTSGATMSSGRSSGTAMLTTAAAGYFAPTLAAVAVALLTAHDLARSALIGSVALLGLVLLYIRNLFGVLIVLACGGAIAVLIWRAPPAAHLIAGYFIGSFLAIGALRDACGLWGVRRRGSRSSDADTLARCTHIPAVLWNIFFIAGCAAGAALVGYVQFL